MIGGHSAFAPEMGIPQAERLARYFRLYFIANVAAWNEDIIKELQEQ